MIALQRSKVCVFPVADGDSVRAETIDLSKSIKLRLRYSVISDDGVELEFIMDGKRTWRAVAEPLGVAQSCYEYAVKCALVDRQVGLIALLGIAGHFGYASRPVPRLYLGSAGQMHVIMFPILHWFFAFAGCAFLGVTAMVLTSRRYPRSGG